MNIQQESEQIVAHAQADYKAGKLTAEQFQEVTRIPMKDLVLYEMGHMRCIPAPITIHENGEVTTLDVISRTEVSDELVVLEVAQ